MPVCNNETTITRITCEKCNTTIEGRFDLCKFCRLTPEQKLFVDVFIKCRGNIKEVEKELASNQKRRIDYGKFCKSFRRQCPKEIDKEELIQAIRLNIAESLKPFLFTMLMYKLPMTLLQKK